MAQLCMSRERPAGWGQRGCRRAGPRFAFAIFLLFVLAAAHAAEGAVCKPGVVRRDGKFVPVAWGPRRAAAPAGPARLRYLGHSSFLISGPAGGRVLLDPYVQTVNPPPDAVTVSNLHETHSQVGPYLDRAPILYGATQDGKPNPIDRLFGGVRVVSFPQVEGEGASSWVINTIFIFQVGGICVAHFGNARFGPSEGQFRQLGKIHVLLIPIDGGFTVPHEIAAKIVKRIGPNVVIPMHYFGPELPEMFWRALQAEGFRRIVRAPGNEIPLLRRSLPPPTTYMVLPNADVP